MDEGTALVWQRKGRCNVSFLQRATVDARLRELCDRLVNEVEGLWRPFLFAAGSKPVELVVEGASQECGSSRCHRVVLPGWTCRLTQHDLRTRACENQRGAKRLKLLHRFPHVEYPDLPVHFHGAVERAAG